MYLKPATWESLLSLSHWDLCLSQLEIELSEQQLNTWIRPLQASEESNCLTLMAPNPFVCNWVQEHFFPRIQEIIGALSTPDGFLVALQIGSGQTVQAAAEPTTLDISASAQSHAPGSAVNPSSHAVDGTSAADQGSGSRARANLNPAYNFETFVEGKSNQFGRAASLQVCKNPGVSYNPFFICGASGMGKTHLMHAVGHGILSENPNARVLYINSEQYVAEMVSALQRNTMDQFKQRYRHVDALLIDDIQFFARKDRTQEEFFHTFNTLYESKSQIVLTCDRYPKEVQGLEERLVSRFQGGMTVAVEPPDLETRVAILQSKAEQEKVSLSTDVCFFIAKCVRSNVRELEGALRRVAAGGEFLKSEITIEMAREALKDIIAVQAKMVTVENIQKTVAEYYKIRLADLSSKTRSRSIARPRQVAMALAKELTNKSLPEIGKAFGGRDHTTVMHACKKIVELKNTDFAMQEDYANLMRILSV